MDCGLVDYSNSDSSNSDCESCKQKDLASLPDKEPPAKKHRSDDVNTAILHMKSREKLPVPSEVLSMFGTEQGDEAANSKDRKGKVRSFPHVRGNWASYIFIPLLFANEEMCLNKFASYLNEYFRLHKFTFQQMPVNELHVSLSRTVPFQHHWIDPITTTLRKKYRHHRSFSIRFSELAYYTNDEKTRSFIGLKVDQGYHELLTLMEETDDCFVQFRLPKFYENPSFHVSLYWCLGDILPLIDELTKTNVQVKWNSLFKDYLPLQGSTELFSSTVTYISLKCGNKLYHFDLES